jgi:DnaK suppressor protein
MEPELTAARLTELSTDLVHLQESLEELLAATELEAKPVKLKDNSSRLSRMDEMHNQSILRANRNLTSNRLNLIARAFERLDQGTYGLCSNCDEAIAFPRLKAYPEANKCLACQSENET